MKPVYPIHNLKEGDRIQNGEATGIIVSAVQPPLFNSRRIYRVHWDGKKAPDSNPYVDGTVATKCWERLKEPLAPLRRIIDYTTNEHGTVYEVLECGHRQVTRQDIYGETNARRRRCKACLREAK